MNNDGLIIGLINKIIQFSQDKCKSLSEKSIFIQNIDNLILLSILGTLILSVFASSDSIGYVALIALFLTVIKSFMKQGEKTEMNLFEKFLFVYFLVVIISLAGSSLLHLSLKGFFKTFTYLGFYFSAVQYYKNNLKQIPLTIGLIGLCVVSQGIVGLFQNFAQVGEISGWQDVSNLNPEDVMTRVYGTIKPFNPNLFGGYLVAALPSLFGIPTYFALNKKNKAAIISLGLTILTSIVLLLSGCRGAYIGLACIVTCFFAFIGKIIWDNNNEKIKKLYLYIIGGVIAFATTAILFVSSLRTRVFSIFAMRNDSSTSFRFNVYQAAIQMAKDNWLLGIGLGNQNFREIYGLYMRTGFDALSAYNVFLEIFVESGIFALIAFLGFLITLIIKSIKFILNSHDLNKTIIIAIALTTVISVMIHGLVDTIFFRPQIQFVFWTMTAIISAVLKSESAEY